MEPYVVIPAFNEQSKIAEVLKELQDAGYRKLIVIDDGSADATERHAREQGATVLRHIANRGQGAALKTGIDYALLLGADIIVTFDADGQHTVEDIKKLCAPIEDGQADVALGSRFLNKTQRTPPIRKIFLKGGTLIIRLMYGLKLTDSHNGFRALSRHAAQVIDLRSNRMEHASEILDEIKRKKLRYIEVPTTIKYTEYSKQKGQSTWNAFNILYKMLLQKLMK